MAETEHGRAARLTKSSVDRSGPEAARYIVWDSDLSGFGLRVEPSGTKTYLVRYRLGAGGRKATRRQFKIGKVGDANLTPDEARRLAKVKLAEATVGSDPQGLRAHARAEETVAEFCQRYVEANPANKKASTRHIDDLRIKNHIVPLIGSLRLSEVRRDDVERLMRAVIAGKVKAEPKENGEPKDRARGGRAAAGRTVGLLQGIFGYAVALKIIAENPAHGVKRPKDRHKERFLSAAEIERLFATLAEMSDPDAKTDGRAKGKIVTGQHADIIRLLLLTGARKNEIAGLRWSEVDGSTQFLRLGDSKTGQKEIPLGAAAQTILAGLTRTDHPWVFPDPRDGARPVRNVDWAWETIRESAGLEGVRVHDLRHSFASIAAGRGLSLRMIGELLGHKHPQTTQRYAHLERSALHEAADLIGKQIDGAAAGKSADVSEMRG